MSRGIGVTEGTYFPRNINQFVEALQFHAQVDPVTQIYRVSLGNILAAGTAAQTLATNLVLNKTFAAGATVIPGDANWNTVANISSATGEILGARFGRRLFVDCAGANTTVCKIWGRDWLGQPMYEEIKFNGTTAVSGKKAFKFIDRINFAANAGAVGLGVTDAVGLPFRTQQVLSEISRTISTGVDVVETLGTLTQPLSPLATSTATSVDPRGLYDPTQALVATEEIIITAIADSSIRAFGTGSYEDDVKLVGGLYGVAHYYEAP